MYNIISRTEGVVLEMNPPLVEFKNVFFRYSEDSRWVLKNCSFIIEKDEWIAIIGHNGSGKSTIAKLMNGLLFPTEGQILINNIELTHETVWDIRRDIGMVFQNPDNQFVGATVQDDIAFGMENRGMERSLMIKRIESSLEAVEMTDYRLIEPHRLSGGQKQRIAIAGILAVSPSLLILDEATVMLDPLGRTEIMKTVADVRVAESLSLITITHDLNEVAQADRVIVLNEGEIWKVTEPRILFTEKEALKNMNLDIPFITSLAEELQKRDIDIKNEPLNDKELLEALWTLHLRT